MKGTKMYIVRWRETEDSSTFRSEFFNAEEAMSEYENKKQENLSFLEIKTEEYKPF